MNIFYLDKCTTSCAQQHVDKHVVKMILEYAQLLSTAHRMLDGKEYIDASSGRRIRRWKIEDEYVETKLFKASHINHPSAIWARENKSNYRWLSFLLNDLCAEYTHRYGKIHSVQRSGLAELLKDTLPRNIKDGVFFEPPPAMPDECKVPGDSIASYKNYYIQKKSGFAKWTKREQPVWYVLN